jgi:hypothetical protein
MDKSMGSGFMVSDWVHGIMEMLVSTITIGLRPEMFYGGSVDG